MINRSFFGHVGTSDNILGHGTRYYDISEKKSNLEQGSSIFLEFMKSNPKGE